MNGSSVVVADSHEIIREGIVARLKRELDVNIVAEASDGYSTLKFCRQFKPEILIMDLSLQRPSVLSSEASVANAMFVLSHGAVGFMPRQSRGADFVNAVRAVQTGFAYLPRDLLDGLVNARRNVKRSGNVYGLSPRELEILEACINELSTKEIAQQLSISTRTVETHRNSIHRKTACKSYKSLTYLIDSNQASGL